MTFESVNQIMSQARESGRILRKSKLRCTLHSSHKFLRNISPRLLLLTPQTAKRHYSARTCVDPLMSCRHIAVTNTRQICRVKMENSTELLTAVVKSWNRSTFGVKS